MPGFNDSVPLGVDPRRNSDPASWADWTGSVRAACEPDQLPTDSGTTRGLIAARPHSHAAESAQGALGSGSIFVMETVTLWRPTGPDELALVEQAGWRAWPPLLPDQPIFYPVLNEDYATRIARDWNVRASGVGYVTRFEVEKSFLDNYEVQHAGGQTILEYWIPAEDLDSFNAHIVRLIEVVAEFR